MSQRTYIMSLSAMLLLFCGLFVTARAGSSLRQSLFATATFFETDRDRDGLLGPVRRIKTETAKLITKDGTLGEGRRQVLETAAYDIKGTKIENAYFPLPGSNTLTGKELYKYDEKGNISEMSLLNADGSLRGKEVYSYEFDSVGNWIKMSTSVAVIEGGKLKFEPTEVTYRTISYYLDATMANMVQNPLPVATVPGANPVTTAVTNPVGGNTSGTSANAPSNSVPALGTNTNVTTKQNVEVSNEAPATPERKPEFNKPISGGVLNGKAVELPAPKYPEIAKRMRATGIVSVEVLIDTSGRVISAKALNGNNMFQPAAVEAAMRARFSPTTLSGQPVQVSGVINFNFAFPK